ncbi:metalloregulator ArsR/SmtB family transcription factor [Flavicella sp.]|uniref:ArsR/SmtB family transcription factor n=1 Tax=Flavicella sp. TaxID=2957742 RepID=UPI0026073ED7|nr:metalloregulator ArsR/SmtB family transcription factor [Flavicella sp.]MDG1806001.1 metalloregulator ArsR/SmtB family transcription factor [Flavicella sp.]MDG2280417.1 metalloregulator ArsR/SmtB family transcription factor [Flavicella sp.]
MNFQTKYLKKLTKTASVLKVIAHPVRLQILEALGDKGSLTVSNIKDAIQTDVEQSMLSHHLIKMKDNGVLSSVKKGKFNHYSLVDKSLVSLLPTK